MGVFQLFKDLDSLERSKGKANNSILSVDCKRQVLYSSSDSISTEADSGIFSEDSDSSVVVTKTFQKPSDDTPDELDEGHTKGEKKSGIKVFRSHRIIHQRPSHSPSIHKTIECGGTVTVNGVCYQCM